MTKEEYYRIRDEVYKNAGMDKYDFDLMMLRVVTRAVEEERERIIAANAPEIEKVNVYIKALEDAVAAEREACAQIAFNAKTYLEAAAAIRERGAP